MQLGSNCFWKATYDEYVSIRYCCQPYLERDKDSERCMHRNCHRTSPAFGCKILAWCKGRWRNFGTKTRACLLLPLPLVRRPIRKYLQVFGLPIVVLHNVHFVGSIWPHGLPFKKLVANPLLLQGLRLHQPRYCWSSAPSPMQMLCAFKVQSLVPDRRICLIFRGESLGSQDTNGNGVVLATVVVVQQLACMRAGVAPP
jgi:hypothetical protein